MVDKLSKEQRRKNMQAIKSKDMKPELTVRKSVHGMGFRFRLHRKDLPGKPDLVFPSKKKVIFVHGCFWHQHPDPALHQLVLLPGHEPGTQHGAERTVSEDQAPPAELAVQHGVTHVPW